MIEEILQEAIKENKLCLLLKFLNEKENRAVLKVSFTKVLLPVWFSLEIINTS